jgi:flap endonuclease-1
MGIKNLQKFLDNHIPNTKGIREINVSILEDKAIAIDILIYLYQYACAIKDSVEHLVNKDGEVVTHIQAIVVKALGFLKKKIKPIFVFDGVPPEHKNDTLQDRTDKKTVAKQLVKDYDKQISDLYVLMQTTPTTMEEINSQLEAMEQVKILKKKKITASK